MIAEAVNETSSSVTSLHHPHTLVLAREESENQLTRIEISGSGGGGKERRE
jgi:hypothetical protein